MTESTNQFQDTSNPKIMERIKDFYDLVLKVKAIEKNLDDVKKLRTGAEELLVQTFESNGIHSLSREDRNFYLKFTLHANFKEDTKEKGHDWIRGLGHEDMITESINVRTLASFIKELKEEDEKLELPDCLNTFTKKSIGHRKK
ncbi:MAG TPA: hypothetical protein ENI23_03435 [bacterium]|nr:hypothetical protein [bacterium]